jgi:serine protease Do
VRVAAAPTPDATGRLGLVVGDPDDDQRKAHDLTDYGVMVREVGDGAAQRGGIRRGDVILMIDRVRVRDAAHFERVMEGLRTDRPVAVLVQRSGAPVFLAVSAGATD